MERKGKDNMYIDNSASVGSMWIRGHRALRLCLANLKYEAMPQ